MTFPDRLQAFASLGEYLRLLSPGEIESLATKVHQENGWFTPESVSLALESIGMMLKEDKLKSWALTYLPEPRASKTIGVSMAGNIPLVGFHDFLTVLISGHRLKYKPSSKDTILLPFILQKLVEVEPRFAARVSQADHLKDVDAIIATGSNNTARYFEYYFRKVPHIIRKNRVTCAIIEGDEPASEIALLGHDIFSYYGLGCRNVSTVFVPRGFDMKLLLDNLQPFETVIQNHKYANNYLYQKTLSMMNQEPFLDNGFLLVKENINLFSPVATLYYSAYDDLDSLKEFIHQHADELQVVLSAKGWFAASLPFGTAQFPAVDDYADGVDTMKFLMEL